MADIADVEAHCYKYIRRQGLGWRAGGFNGTAAISMPHSFWPELLFRDQLRQPGKDTMLLTNKIDIR
jgi:hypothetical protein